MIPSRPRARTIPRPARPVETMRHDRGFTLIEMMVSVAVLALVSLYLTDMLVRQNRTYTVVDQVTEAQQNLRAIADLMEREARVTGFMVGEAGAVCGVDNTNASDVLFVTDSDAINPVNQNSLDLGVSIAGGYAGNGNAEGLNLVGGVNPTIVDGVAFYDNTNDGVADSDFLANGALGQFGGVIVYDRANPASGTSCGIVTNVGANSITVDFTVRVGTAAPQALAPVGTPIAAGPGADLVAVPATWYAIVPPAASGAASPQLWRNGMPLADDVEDLQVAFFFDSFNTNGLVDGNIAGAGAPPVSDLEYPGSNPGGVQYVSNAWDHSFLRELRLNFVVTTRAQDPDVLVNPAMAQGAFVTTENRVAPGGGPDGFRRRLQTMTIRPRNVGFRPPET